MKRVGQYTGPDGCIDDHVERKYFDTPEVSGVYECTNTRKEMPTIMKPAIQNHKCIHDKYYIHVYLHLH